VPKSSRERGGRRGWLRIKGAPRARARARARPRASSDDALPRAVASTVAHCAVPFPASAVCEARPQPSPRPLRTAVNDWTSDTFTVTQRFRGGWVCFQKDELRAAGSGSMKKGEAISRLLAELYGSDGPRPVRETLRPRRLEMASAGVPPSSAQGLSPIRRALAGQYDAPIAIPVVSALCRPVPTLPQVTTCSARARAGACRVAPLCLATPGSLRKIAGSCTSTDRRRAGRQPGSTGS